MYLFINIYIFFQLVLVGVCCSAGGDGSDSYAEISLQPLPEYTVPSDGITMTCITCTDKGRIFMAGRDGHIYELQYSTGSGWHKRCRKVCLTAGVGSVISRYVPLFEVNGLNVAIPILNFINASIICFLQYYSWFIKFYRNGMIILHFF